jgi:hypothetical protein
MAIVQGRMAKICSGLSASRPMAFGINAIVSTGKCQTGTIFAIFSFGFSVCTFAQISIYNWFDGN